MGTATRGLFGPRRVRSTSPLTTSTRYQVTQEKGFPKFKKLSYQDGDLRSLSMLHSHVRPLFSVCDLPDSISILETGHEYRPLRQARTLAHTREEEIYDDRAFPHRRSAFLLDLATPHPGVWTGGGPRDTRAIRIDSFMGLTN